MITMAPLTTIGRQMTDTLERTKEKTPWWGYPLIPFLFVINWAAHLGQVVTGDKPSGAFPSGVAGGCFGVMTLMVLIVAIAVMLFNGL